MNTLKKIISEHIRYRRTIFKLAKSDLIKTYKGTALGWSWALIRPAMILSVYYFAFTVGLRSGRPIEGYSFFLWLIAGVVPWFYIQGMIVAGAASVKKYRFLVTKIKYPVSTIPTFVGLSHLFVNLILIFIMLLIFMISGHAPDLYWLQIPFYILLMFVFCSVWSLFAGILATFSSDFMQLIRSATIMLFWMSGIMYDVNRIDSEIIKNIMLLNPITVIINGFRNSLVYKEWFWQNPYELFSFVAITFILLVLGLVCYKKLEREIVDIL